MGYIGFSFRVMENQIRHELEAVGAVKWVGHYGAMGPNDGESNGKSHGK